MKLSQTSLYQGTRFLIFSLPHSRFIWPKYHRELKSMWESQDNINWQEPDFLEAIPTLPPAWQELAEEIPNPEKILVAFPQKKRIPTYLSTKDMELDSIKHSPRVAKVIIPPRETPSYVCIGVEYGYIVTDSGKVKTWKSYSGASRYLKKYLGTDS